MDNADKPHVKSKRKAWKVPPCIEILDQERFILDVNSYMTILIDADVFISSVD
jgi:hypothetical protein